MESYDTKLVIRMTHCNPFNLIDVTDRIDRTLWLVTAQQFELQNTFSRLSSIKRLL